MHLSVHARTVASILGGGILLLLFLTVSELLDWYTENTRKLKEFEPRIARLQGYTQSIDGLRRASTQAKEQLSALTYPASSDSGSTGATVQQQLRQHFEAAGLNVTGSQVLAPKVQQGFEDIHIDLTATGPMESLDQALLVLQTMRPLLLVHALELSPAPTRHDDKSQNIVLRLSVSVVRLQ